MASHRGAQDGQAEQLRASLEELLMLKFHRPGTCKSQQLCLWQKPQGLAFKALAGGRLVGPPFLPTGAALPPLLAQLIPELYPFVPFREGWEGEMAGPRQILRTLPASVAMATQLFLSRCS